MAASRQPQTAWRVMASIDAVPLLLLLLQSDQYCKPRDDRWQCDAAIAIPEHRGTNPEPYRSSHRRGVQRLKRRAERCHRVRVPRELLLDQNWHCDLCQAVVLPLAGPGGHAWGFIRVRAVVAASALPAYAPPWTQGHSPLPGSGAAAAAQTARVVGRGINIKANKKAQQ